MQEPTSFCRLCGGVRRAHFGKLLQRQYRAALFCRLDQFKIVSRWDAAPLHPRLNSRVWLLQVCGQVRQLGPDGCYAFHSGIKRIIRFNCQRLLR